MPARSDIFTTSPAENRLRYMRGYLCGAMDRVVDGGEAWRVALQRDLAKLGVFWLDPTQKPIDIGIEDPEMRVKVGALKRQDQFAEASIPIKVIRAVDLRMVDHSDFLVANLDLEVHACGTYEELFLANRQKKPVIIHIEQGKQNVPNWLLGTFPHEMFFSTWGEVREYLKHIAYSPTVKHLNRWMFFHPPFKFDPESVANFWLKVKKTPGCWLWNGRQFPNGYGNFRCRGKQHLAHRVAYELVTGYIDPRLHVLHQCDNPQCVNPSHLFAGSQKNNIHDMFSKGRQGARIQSGESNSNAKLTLKDVKAIRSNTTDSHAVLGRKYDMSAVQIGHIRRGKSR